MHKFTSGRTRSIVASYTSEFGLASAFSELTLMRSSCETRSPSVARLAGLALCFDAAASKVTFFAAPRTLARLPSAASAAAAASACARWRRA